MIFNLYPMTMRKNGDFEAFFHEFGVDPTIEDYDSDMVPILQQPMHDYILASDYPNELKHLMFRLYRERYYMSFAGTNFQAAATHLCNVIAESANYFGKRINEIDSQITALATQAFKETTKTNTDLGRTLEEDAYSDTESFDSDATEDSTHHKFADGGKTAFNADLTLDTYLSASDKLSTRTGERHSERTSDIAARRKTDSLQGDAQDNYIERLREMDPETLEKLEGLIRQTYSDWLRHIDKHLIFDFYLDSDTRH